MRRLSSGLLLLALLVLGSGTASPRWVTLAATASGTSAAPDTVAAPLSTQAYLARSFQYVGWKPEAVAYVTAHVRIELSQWDQTGAAGYYVPGPAPTSTRINVPNVPNTVGERVISHELSHAMDDARGYRDEMAGVILYDVWRLSQDESYPAAAWSARQVLQLRPQSRINDRFKTSFRTMLDRQDWPHLTLAVWEGVGWDVGKLPPWFREAYFPQLRPGAPVQEQPLQQDADPAPPDLASRTQRVLDLIAGLCGPILPGARVKGPSVRCLNGRNTAWWDVPYAPLPGVAGRGPAAPAAPAQPVKVTAPPALAAAAAPVSAADTVPQSPPPARAPAPPPPATGAAAPDAPSPTITSPASDPDPSADSDDASSDTTDGADATGGDGDA